MQYCPEFLHPLAALSRLLCGMLQYCALLTDAPSLSPTHSTLMTLPCTPRPLSFSTILKAWSASQSGPSHSTSTKVSAGKTRVHANHTRLLTQNAHALEMLGLPTAFLCSSALFLLLLLVHEHD